MIARKMSSNAHTVKKVSHRSNLRAQVGCVLMALLAMTPAVYSETRQQETGSFFDDREDGWHWYEDPPAEIEKEEENLAKEPPAVGQPTKSETAPLSTSWIRQTLPTLRDAAIDNPSEENVRAYFYAQRIMMDKAQVFSDVAQQVVNNDPLLDENLRLPFASAAKVSFLQSANDAKKELLDGLSETVGFWFFYDETCSYCQDQIGPINELAKRHGVTIEVIHKNGDSVRGLSSKIKVRRATGQFETLGIKFTPAVMMVAPPDGYYLVSQGFTAYATLVDRVIAAANQYGLISEDQYYAAVPTSKGILRTDAVDVTESVDWNNSDEWVPYIRNQIAKTYGIDVPGEDYDEE